MRCDEDGPVSCWAACGWPAAAAGRRAFPPDTPPTTRPGRRGPTLRGRWPATVRPPVRKGSCVPRRPWRTGAEPARVGPGSGEAVPSAAMPPSSPPCWSSCPPPRCSCSRSWRRGCSRPTSASRSRPTPPSSARSWPASRSGRGSAGKVADRRDPRTLIGPLLIVGGALGFVAIPVVDCSAAGCAGRRRHDDRPDHARVLPPAAVLSAVTPGGDQDPARVARRDRPASSGACPRIGTAGAIIGTFVTGSCSSRGRRPAPSSASSRCSCSCWAWPRSCGCGGAAADHRRRCSPSVAAAGARSPLATRASTSRRYYCACIEMTERDGGRALWLDTLRHSYVDLEDPTYLEFAYTQWFGDVIAARRTADRSTACTSAAAASPCRSTCARPGRVATRRCSKSTRCWWSSSQDELGLELGDDIVRDRRRPAAARRGDDRRLRPGVGDAFGGVSVPWHLATREFLAAGRRRDDRRRRARDERHRLRARDFLRA